MNTTCAVGGERRNPAKNERWRFFALSTGENLIWGLDGKQSTMHEERIGHVEHFYPKAHAIVVEVESGKVHRGDTIHLKGENIDAMQRVQSIEMDHKPIPEAKAGESVGIGCDFDVKGKADVFLVHSEFPGEEY